MKAEGRLSYLSAVCMGCLEGWSARLQCRNQSCSKVWDGSQLILGTMYSYDIFAASPCCAERLKVCVNKRGIKKIMFVIFSVILVANLSFTRSRGLISSPTTARQCHVLSVGSRTSILSSLSNTHFSPRMTCQGCPVPAPCPAPPAYTMVSMV